MDDQTAANGNPSPAADNAGVNDAQAEAPAVERKLHPGGPPVDYAAVALHAAGELEGSRARSVREQILTWEAWNQAYWDALRKL